MPNTNHSSFSSRIGFLAAASSSAVGVGNIWRFPYLVGKYGGAAFVLMYVFFVIVLGYPIVLAKLSFGRNKQGGTFKAYSSYKSKIWGFIGLGSTLISFFVLSYYSMITGWLIGYFFKLFSTDFITNTEDFGSHFNEFTSNTILNIFYTGFTIFLLWLIVKKNINEGIEKISKILMPIFIVMMIALIIWALTLEGSSEGLKFYLLPKLDNLSFDGVYAALAQSFLSLSIGTGICITFGSYVNKNDNLTQSSLVIVFSDTIVSLLGGLIIFPLIINKGIEPNQGVSLIFVSLPLAFQALGPILGKIFGATFFILLVFAAITSAISMMEVIVKYIMEKFLISRKKSITFISILIFIVSLGSIFSFDNSSSFINIIKNKSCFELMDLIWGDLGMPIIGLAFSFFVVYKWKISSLFKEIDIKNIIHQNFINISLKFIAPLLIGIILIVKVVELFI